MATKKLALVPAVEGEIVKSPTKARALAIERRLQEIFELNKRNFLETGRLVVEAEDGLLWELLTDASGAPYTSKDHWLRTALPYARSSAIQAAAVVRRLQGLPDATLEEIPRVNLTQLAGLPENKRTQVKWIEAAKNLPEKDFKAQILKQIPEPDGPAKPLRVGFKLRPGEMLKKERAWKKIAAELGNPDATEEECLMRCITFYLDQNR